MDVPVPVAPSPKLQVIVYGAVPPVVVAVNVTALFTAGVEGEVVKLVDGGQLLVQAPNAPSMFGAPASLELSEDNPHAASIVDR
jgi:hypothetical protein